MMANRSIGVILLCIWLIVANAMILIPALQFQLAAVLLAILAIFAGIFLLIGR